MGGALFCAAGVLGDEVDWVSVCIRVGVFVRLCCAELACVEQA